MKKRAEKFFIIGAVRSKADLEAAGQLFDAYAAALGVDLAFQGYADERANMPGKYAPPAGELLLAKDLHQRPLGCVALRPLIPSTSCEMKRLYVSPEGRGVGLGTALINAVMTEATRIGYADIRLDTLPTMSEAIALYEKAGFRPIEPYYDTPLAGTRFLGRSLAA